MWTEFLTALSLVLVIEGIMPFLNPNQFRETMQTLIGMDNASIRIIGFLSMLAGVTLLYLVH